MREPLYPCTLNLQMHGGYVREPSIPQTANLQPPTSSPTRGLRAALGWIARCRIQDLAILQMSNRFHLTPTVPGVDIRTSYSPILRPELRVKWPQPL